MLMQVNVVNAIESIEVVAARTGPPSFQVISQFRPIVVEFLFCKRKNVGSHVISMKFTDDCGCSSSRSGKRIQV